MTNLILLLHSLSPQFSKETRFPRWRAYAKGCLDLCGKYSQKAIEERAKLTDVAPKDVKQLEVLRPVNTPSMGDRFQQAIEKEKRLEVASRPIQKTKQPSQKEDVDDDVDDEEEPKVLSKAAKKRKRKAKNNAIKRGKLDEFALEQQKDTLEEGIDWSDDDE